MRKKKVKKRKKLLPFLLIFILLGITGIILSYYFKMKKEEQITLNREKLRNEIVSHYSNYVKTNKVIDLYNEKEKKIGKIGNNIELSLNEEDISYDTKYFITTVKEKEYYIKYQDVDKIEKLSEYNNRYKKYIQFNENVITKDNTSFYEENGDLIYQFNESYDLPIIIKEKDRYGVEFENRLLYVKSEDVKELKENKNTDESNAKGIPILNYHFVFKNGTTGCNEEICHSEAQMTQHFS